ncbi:MAG: hypothetical protein WC843_03550 [Candidatus Gracilibacteria bacterium]|jgi:hypothetical protein
MSTPEKMQSLPSFADVIAQYKGCGADLNPPPQKKEKFPFTPALIEKFKIFGKEMVGRYTDGNLSPKGLKYKKIGTLTRKVLTLGETLLDEESDLKILANKVRVTDTANGENSIKIEFRLSLGSQGLCGLDFIDLGNENFKLTDRYTVPEYRQQGFADALLKSGEAFMQELSQSTVRVENSAVALTAEVGQLDVIYWLWKNDYRPQTTEDEQNLERVLAGDPNLKLCADLYVFDKDRDEYLRGNDGELVLNKYGKKVIDYHNSMRINFVKKFEAGVSKDISDIAGQTRSLGLTKFDIDI